MNKYCITSSSYNDKSIKVIIFFPILIWKLKAIQIENIKINNERLLIITVRRSWFKESYYNWLVTQYLLVLALLFRTRTL